MKAFQWIKDFVKDKQRHQAIKDLLPDVFDNYLFVPWATGIIEDFPFDSYPDNNDTIENLNKQHAIEKEFGIFLNKRTEDRYRQATLKEIAERFKVDYCADTYSLLKYTPGTSTLLSATKRQLTELITVLKRDRELNLYIEDNYRFQGAYDNWRFREENFIQDISDYLNLQKATGWDSTSYLFPKDLSWCLCTAEDFVHFILCCDDATHSIVKELKNLETFEVNYDCALGKGLR